jgi:hypothetical protein
MLSVLKGWLGLCWGVLILGLCWVAAVLHGLLLLQLRMHLLLTTAHLAAELGGPAAAGWAAQVAGVL